MASQESIAFWKQLLEGHRATPVPLRDCEARKRRRENREAADAGDCTAGRDAGAVAASGARDGGTAEDGAAGSAHEGVAGGERAVDLTTGVAHNGRPEVEGGEQILGLFLNTVRFAEAGERQLETTDSGDIRGRTADRAAPPYPMVDLREQMVGKRCLTRPSTMCISTSTRTDGQDGQRYLQGE